MVDREIFLNKKRQALKKYFSKMNEMQQEALFTVKGPLLVLAGAGSGKTTVLVNRIANMVYFGDAFHNDSCPDNISDNDLAFLGNYIDGNDGDNEKLKDLIAIDCVNPWNILAITFTNKAAGELKERLSTMLGEDGQKVTAVTFHSACVRILRREIDKLGYSSSFTIYDSDDSQRVIKSCLSELEIEEKNFPPKMLMSVISGFKDKMRTPESVEEESQTEYRSKQISKIYTLYQKKLKSANAVDFDDIICLTVKLFEEYPDVLSHYQNLYKYIVVDEYQDTNMVQYKLVSMLSQKYKNICVVGDDDQSIYKFRGATIENILSFEEQFENSKVIKLEQNYRSTQNILTVSNKLIENNRGRKGKTLWSAKGEGEKITVFKSKSETGEARYIADTILNNIKDGKKYNSHAVLYRMNAQSNSIERAFVSSGIAYRIIGGLKFYDRKEIKDIIAYLSVINNTFDLLRLKRIINEPKRGIGNATLQSLEQITEDLEISPLEVMRNSADYAPLAKKSKALTDLAEMFDKLTKISEEKPLEELLDALVTKSGYLKFLKEQGDEGTVRLDNINELKSTMIKYTQDAEEPSLSGFLEEIALYTDVDRLNENDDCVVMMTIHSSKGLEFPNVFIVGMEEGIFPGTRSLDSEADLEEERRLAYVGMTRAKEKLTLTNARERMLFGMTNRNRISRFIKELPTEYLEIVEERGFSNTSGASGAGLQSATSISLQAQLANKRRTDEKLSEQVIFNVGERVKHLIFGEGTILNVTKMSNDSMLEIAFDKAGTKKIMANFAKIQHI